VHTHADGTERIVRVTILGMAINLLLVALKLGVGLVVGSVALIADAIHSISDLSTDIVVVLGAKMSSKPADECHPYGHGKYETISALFIGFALVAAGFLVAWQAGLSLYRQEQSFPGAAVIVVAVFSIVAKEVAYRITQRTARRLKSVALHVNAWHHRSDALSSVAVLFGAIAAQVGWGYGDQAAAIVVGVMVSGVGLKALWDVFLELTEGSVSSEEQTAIVRAIESVPGVKNWHRLRTRLVGREVFMDVHVRVDAGLTVADGHSICTAVEEKIAELTDRPINVVVHCEPYRSTESDSQEGQYNAGL